MLPSMRAALVSVHAIDQVVSLLEKELKISMLATGSRTLGGLKRALCFGNPYEDSLKAWIENPSQKV